MHTAMNAGTLRFADPFPYHPHITLAQELPREDVAAVRELACARWREFRGERQFAAKDAVFVQNTIDNYWIDLAQYSLGGHFK